MVTLDEENNDRRIQASRDNKAIKRQMGRRISQSGAITPLEHDEQVALVQWAAAQEHKWPELAWLFAIPNGGHRSKRVAIQLQAEGLKAGPSDLCLPVRRDPYAGLWLELKRRNATRSALKRPQREFGRFVFGQGYAWAVARGWEEGAELITKYLEAKWAGIEHITPWM